MNKHLQLSLALALALGSSPLLALGLGQIQVKSSLNQPLDAEIELLSATRAELDELRVQLASSRDVERVGAGTPGPWANLKFSVERSGGKAVIRVSTSERVTAPFLSFLLDANWGKGRLLREYTVLLDPPRTAPAVARTQPASTPARETPKAAPTPTPTPKPPAPAPAPTRPAAPARTAPATSPAAATPAAVPASSPAPASGGQYGPVASGQTLWAIASQLRPDAALSMNQMMMALLQANPEAFIDGNINRLKRGAILRIPSRTDVEAIAAADAAAQVRSQMQSWRGEAPTTPQPAEPRSAQPERASPAAARPSGSPRVQLVPPRSGDTQNAQSGATEGGAGSSELRAELARSREEVASREREVGELRERVRELERIQADGERLINLKDSELNALKKRLEDLEAERAQAAPAAVPATSPQTTPAASPAETTAPPSDTAAGDGASSAAAVPAVAEPPARPRPRPAATTPAPASGAPAPSSATPAREAPPAKAWFENVWVLGGAGALVLGLLGLVLMRRRSPAAAAGAGTGRSAGRLDSGALAASIPAQTGASSFSEHDEDAMDIEAGLLDAVAESPSDLSRHLELVQHYYGQSDSEAFEGAAEAMYAQVDDPDDLRWKQVLAMGHELLPDHPLFTARAAAAPVPPPPPPPAALAAAPEPAPAQPPAMPELDLGSFSRGAPAAPAAQFDEGLDFDLPEPASTVATTAATEAASEEPTETMSAFGAGDEDASATKLELARAYLDMGDVEGARAMLEEVMSEGNAGQRSEAKRLLDEIR